MTNTLPRALHESLPVWCTSTSSSFSDIESSYTVLPSTICLSAPIYICGLILLTVSASPLGFGDFPFYPDSNGGWAYEGFWAAVTIMGLGCGFIKPCVSVFAAEQLKDKDGNDASPRTLEKLYLYW